MSAALRKEHPALRPDDELLRCPRSRRWVVRELLLGPAQGASKARVVERLQQVVERSRLEGAQRIFVVSRHEYDGGRQIAAQELQHVEAIALRHSQQQHDHGGECGLRSSVRRL